MVSALGTIINKFICIRMNKGWIKLSKQYLSIANGTTQKH